MAFSNAADFDMAAFPLKPELKFIHSRTESYNLEQGFDFVFYSL